MKNIFIIIKNFIINNNDRNFIDYKINQRITFINNSKEEKECVFLGSNYFINEDNFGNPKEIDIIMDAYPSYSTFLYNLIGCKYIFQLTSLRIQAKSNSDIKQTMIIHQSDLNGNSRTSPLTLREWIIDKQQIQGIVEKKEFNLKINGNVHFKFKISPNSSISFSFTAKVL